MYKTSRNNAPPEGSWSCQASSTDSVFVPCNQLLIGINNLPVWICVAAKSTMTIMSANNVIFHVIRKPNMNAILILRVYVLYNRGIFNGSNLWRHQN